MYKCQILKFAEKKYTRKQIEKACGLWAFEQKEDYAIIPYNPDDAKLSIMFTDKVFETEMEAMQYLKGTLCSYKQTAVRVKRNLGAGAWSDEEVKKYNKLAQRTEKYKNDLLILENKSYYADAKSKTVTCKNCGSVLATAYCGSTWHNKCPVCRVDVRPASFFETFNKKQQEYNQLVLETQEMYRQLNSKAAETPEMYWYVACEVDV